jgi:parvulin-like peptidyl-prolyl isomerase
MPKQTSNRQPAPNITSITYWRKFAVHRVFYLGIAILFGVSAVAYFGSPGGGGPNGAAERGAAAIAVVNGEPVPRAIFENQWAGMRQQMQQMRRFGGAATTPISEAQEQGRILDRLIEFKVLESAAKKRGLTVSDEAIEKRINEYKKAGPGGKPLTDADLEKMLGEQGGTLQKFRDELRQGLLPEILRESIANKENVTEEDLQKTFDEIKARRILFPVKSPGSVNPGAKPDAQAKRDAQDVLVKIKAGADFAKTADLYSKDPANQQTELDKNKKPVTRKHGGLLSPQGEGWYKRGGGQPKEFEDAAFALAKGQVSDVVKTPEGYQIIKVEDTRRKLPDDYAKTKADLLMQLKMERAQKPIQELIDKERKAAKVEWKDPSLEWRYEFAKLPPVPGMSPVAGPEDRAQDQFLAKLRAYTEKHKDDSAALLVLGQTLDRKNMFATATPKPPAAGEREKTRDEAIAAYEQALKLTEDQQARFRLASLYKEAGRNEDAARHYDTIMRLLSYDEDPNSRFIYQQLVSEYKAIGKTDKSKEALTKVAELTKKAEEERKKQEAAQKEAAAQAAKEKAETAAKAAAEKAKPSGATAGGGTLNVAPSGAQPGGAPAPSEAPKKP